MHTPESAPPTAPTTLAGFGVAARTGAPVDIPPALLAPIEFGDSDDSDDITAASHDGTGIGAVAYLVLGAGCSGLSTALALLEHGVTEPIVLLEARGRYTDDRTWCFWNTEPTPFSHLITMRWDTWQIRSLHATTTGRASAPYVGIAAADFYQDALTRLAAHPNVRIRMQSTVNDVSQGPGDGWSVTTSTGVWRARTLIDARGALAPPDQADTQRHTFIPQQFVGLRIRTLAPVFDPGVATLMDFAVDQSKGIHFMYVLPTSATEALVENTYFSRARLSTTASIAEIRSYLATTHGLGRADFVIDDEERGWIPMTDLAYPTRQGPRRVAVGVRGGAARPSTGYAFLRIQRSARTIAHALATGQPVPDRLDGIRTRALDTVFLRYLHDRPHTAPGTFHRMFARTPTPSLIRFLSDQSTLRDEARLILALPKTPFLAAAARTLLHHTANRFLSTPARTRTLTAHLPTRSFPSRASGAIDGD